VVLPAKIARATAPHRSVIRFGTTPLHPCERRPVTPLCSAFVAGKSAESQRENALVMLHAQA